MNANLKAGFDCFIDKSPLKCLVVNANVNNAYHMMSFSMSGSLLQFFITPVFRSHWRYWFKKAKEIIERNLCGCNKKVIIWSRCASRSYWHCLDI